MQLTNCQQNARKEFYEFLRSDEEAMILEGYAGTGKTTLVMHLITEIQKIDELKRTTVPTHPDTEFALTATTNKAAEALEMASGMEAVTIHSHLGIGVRTDYATGENHLTRKRNAEDPVGQIIFVDEASFIDDKLLSMIKYATRQSKVVFMGDPTQLTPVKCVTTPAFDQKIRRAKLEQVVRQAADNPIQALTKGLREHILGGPFPQCAPDGEFIIHKNRGDFDLMVRDEFTRDGWKSKDSRMLAWTNKTVIAYNNGLHSMAKGRPSFAVGDQAINNHFLSNGKNPIKTDALVTITRLGEERTNYNVLGRSVDTTNSLGLFLPNNPSDIDKAVARAVAEGDPAKVKEIQTTWADFRAAYACTVNKSQGSTYDIAFVDLDDIGKAHDSDQLARMLYVAISRARTKVILTGDLV